MKNSKLFTIVTFLFVIALAVSCKKEESDASNNNTNNTNPTPTFSTYLCGTVIDREGSALQGAIVKFGNETAITNGYGYFSFGNVTTGERCYVNVSRESYFETGLGVFTDANGITNMRIVMTDNLPDTFISGASGGTVNLTSGASVVLPAGGIAYEDGTIYTGNVNVAVDYLNPDDPNFPQIIPGGDLRGIASNGDQMQLISYGMLMVELTDVSGVELNLAPSFTATVNLPVPSSMSANAPASIPSWHFNEDTGYWEETGVLILTGDIYTGSVSHFSTVNGDVPLPIARVTGHVVDCNGEPLSGIAVVVGQSIAYTDLQGTFETNTPTNTILEVHVSEPLIGLTSSSVTTPELNDGQLYNVGILQTQCPGYVTGSITCDFGVLSAFTSLSWSEGFINLPYSAETDFVFMVPANGAAGELNAIGMNTGIVETAALTLPSNEGASVDAGSFELCDGGPSGDYGASMTLNGDVYDNFNFEISTSPQYAFGNYSEGLFMLVYASNSSGYIVVSYPGTSAGSWDLASDVNATVNFNLNGEDWTAQSGTLTVTQSGNVGQPLIGTFSGTVTKVGGTEVITAEMTNGEFNVLRYPDQQ